MYLVKFYLPNLPASVCSFNCKNDRHSSIHHAFTFHQPVICDILVYVTDGAYPVISKTCRNHSEANFVFSDKD